MRGAEGGCKMTDTLKINNTDFGNACLRPAGPDPIVSERGTLKRWKQSLTGRPASC